MVKLGEDLSGDGQLVVSAPEASCVMELWRLGGEVAILGAI